MPAKNERCPDAIRYDYGYTRTHSSRGFCSQHRRVDGILVEFVVLALTLALAKRIGLLASAGPRRCAAASAERAAASISHPSSSSLTTEGPMPFADDGDNRAIS